MRSEPRVSLPLRRFFLPSALLLLLARPASAADVVLVPGTLSGTVGIEGWSFSSSSIVLDGNASGYRSSLSFTGNTFSLMAEGEQTYGTLTLRQNFPKGVFTLVSRQPLFVPAYEPLNVELSRPGGTLVSHIVVNGGKLVSARHLASSADAALKETYSAQVDVSGTGDGRLPMVAGENISLSATATISVLDESGAALCSKSVSIPAKTVSLSPGETVLSTHEVTVSPSQCVPGAPEGGTLTGKVRIEGLPAGLEYSSAQVSIGGPESGRATVTPALPEYRFTNLLAGKYSVSVNAVFTPIVSAEEPSGNIVLPNQSPSTVDVALDGTAVRDFVVPGILVSGVVKTTGFLETRFQSQTLSFPGVRLTDVPGGGSTVGGSASFRFKAPLDRKFKAVLTPGTWGEPTANFRYTDTVGQQIDLAYIARYNKTFVVPESGELRLPDKAVYNGRATIVFDVQEAKDSDPEILISQPQIQASRSHVVDGDYASVTVSRDIQNKASPSVMLVGPRGTYQFVATATINGTQVRFKKSTVEIGTLMPTATGSLVAVELRDGAGAVLPVSLVFDSVEEEGFTSASLTDTGPEVSAGYELLEIVGGSKYLDIGSTATVSGELEVSVTYDPALLGLTPEEETRLELHQYVCESESVCHWERISEPSAPAGLATLASTSSSPHVITGRTSRLGLLSLLLRRVPPSATCVGTPDAPVQVPMAWGTCGVRVGNGLAGGCAAGSSDLVSCSFNGESTLMLGPGTHSVTVRAAAADQLEASCTSYLSVVDAESPRVRVTASPEVLGPPNHQLRPITLHVEATDVCDPNPSVTCAASSSEPDDGKGDGHTAGDILWREGQLYLRAERSGKGQGRVYTITCTARDGSGNASTGTAQVRVP